MSYISSRFLHLHSATFASICRAVPNPTSPSSSTSTSTLINNQLKHQKFDRSLCISSFYFPFIKFVKHIFLVTSFSHPKLHSLYYSSINSNLSVHDKKEVKEENKCVNAFNKYKKVVLLAPSLQNYSNSDNTEKERTGGKYRRDRGSSMICLLSGEEYIEEEDEEGQKEANLFPSVFSFILCTSPTFLSNCCSLFTRLEVCTNATYQKKKNINSEKFHEEESGYYKKSNKVNNEIGKKKSDIKWNDWTVLHMMKKIKTNGVLTLVLP